MQTCSAIINKIRLFIISFALLSFVLNSHASDQDITDAGDVLTIALPLSAWLGTAIARDKDGAIMFTKSFASTMIMTEIGKKTAEKLRPKGTSKIGRASCRERV